jgi:DNA topoisomerase I
VTFDYEAKGGQRRLQSIGDPDVAAIVRTLKKRRGGGEELLAYKDGRRWVDVRSADVNEYVKEAAGRGFSAKDFRTWSGTVLAAVALAVSAPAANGGTSRKRAKSRAIKEVARYLGNTPTIARTSYIDPRIFDRFDGGLTIAGVLPELADDVAPWPDLQGAIEAAVLDLIEQRDGSDALQGTDELSEELEEVAA